MGAIVGSVSLSLSNHMWAIIKLMDYYCYNIEELFEDHTDGCAYFSPLTAYTVCILELDG